MEATELGSQREAFDVPGDVAYFNAASLSPMLHSVRAAGDSALRRRARPWSIRGQDWFEDAERLRSLFAALVGGDAEDVALVPATSYGFAVAARNISLKADQRILVLAEEYPSGIYTWRGLARETGAQVHTVTRQAGQSWTDAVLAALDERIAVVSVPNVHWTDGALLDVEAIATRTRQVGARLVIDASQSVGVMPLNVRALRPDFLISVGYKWLLGPFGRGYLWASAEHHNGKPLEENWILRTGAEDFTRLVDYRDTYQPGARRYDQGQRTLFELTPMAITALEQILAWEPHRIAAQLEHVTSAIAERVNELGIEVGSGQARGPHMLGLRLPGEVLGRIQPALAQANCFAALRGNALRISPHVHVTPADVDRLIHALTMAL